MNEEKTYEVRIDVTADEMKFLEYVAIKFTNKRLDDMYSRILIAHAEQNLSRKREEEIKAALGVEE